MQLRVRGHDSSDWIGRFNFAYGESHKIDNPEIIGTREFFFGVAFTLASASDHASVKYN